MKRILKKIFHTWKIQRQLQANYHFISSNPYIYKSENYPDSFLSKVIKQTTFIIDKNPFLEKFTLFGLVTILCQNPVNRILSF